MQVDSSSPDSPSSVGAYAAESANPTDSPVPNFASTAASTVTVYPPAAATHEDVVADSQLFEKTLNSLLHRLGIPYKVPKIGGNEIDLYRLYCEVTKYGGLEQVMSRKMFVTVCEPFNFPASFTNKSFVMRKLYCNMLHHYEQVYYHRNTGPLVPPPVNDHQAGKATRTGSPAKRSSINRSKSTPTRPPTNHLNQAIKNMVNSIGTVSMASPSGKRKQSDVQSPTASAKAGVKSKPPFQPPACLMPQFSGPLPPMGVKPLVPTQGMPMPGMLMPGPMGFEGGGLMFRGPSSTGGNDPMTHSSIRHAMPMPGGSSHSGPVASPVDSGPPALMPPGLPVGTQIATTIIAVTDSYYVVEMRLPDMDQPITGQMFKTLPPGVTLMPGVLPHQPMFSSVMHRRTSNGRQPSSGVYGTSRMSSHMHVLVPGHHLTNLSTAGGPPVTSGVGHMHPAHGHTHAHGSVGGGLPVVTSGGDIEDLGSLDTGFADEFGFDEVHRWGARGTSCGGIGPLEMGMHMADGFDGDATAAVVAQYGGGHHHQLPPQEVMKKLRLRSNGGYAPRGQDGAAWQAGPGEAGCFVRVADMQGGGVPAVAAGGSVHGGARDGSGPSAFKLYTEDLVRQHRDAVTYAEDGRELLHGRCVRELAAEHWELMSNEEKAPYQQQAMLRHGCATWIPQPPIAHHQARTHEDDVGMQAGSARQLSARGPHSRGHTPAPALPQQTMTGGPIQSSRQTSGDPAGNSSSRPSPPPSHPAGVLPSAPDAHHPPDIGVFTFSQQHAPQHLPPSRHASGRLAPAASMPQPSAAHPMAVLPAHDPPTHSMGTLPLPQLITSTSLPAMFDSSHVYGHRSNSSTPPSQLGAFALASMPQGVFPASVEPSPTLIMPPTLPSCSQYDIQGQFAGGMEDTHAQKQKQYSQYRQAVRDQHYGPMCTAALPAGLPGGASGVLWGLVDSHALVQSSGHHAIPTALAAHGPVRLGAAARKVSMGGAEDEDDAMLHLVPSNAMSDSVLFDGIMGIGTGATTPTAGAYLLRRQSALGGPPTCGVPTSSDGDRALPAGTPVFAQLPAADDILSKLEAGSVYHGGLLGAGMQAFNLDSLKPQGSARSDHAGNGIVQVVVMADPGVLGGRPPSARS